MELEGHQYGAGPDFSRQWDVHFFFEQLLHLPLNFLLSTWAKTHLVEAYHTGSVDEIDARNAPNLVDISQQSN